jgi:hypothetical protein
VLSTLQWKTPNLDLMATASKQRFAVLYNQSLGDRFAIETLEQAHIQGAMSGVKLVSVHKDVLRIFLSDEVAGATFPAIEALWEPIKELDLNRRLEVDFSCEHEVYPAVPNTCSGLQSRKCLSRIAWGLSGMKHPFSMTAQGKYLAAMPHHLISIILISVNLPPLKQQCPPDSARTYWRM